jgi:hypothetical protein
VSSCDDGHGGGFGRRGRGERAEAACEVAGADAAVQGGGGGRGCSAAATDAGEQGGGGLLWRLGDAAGGGDLFFLVVCVVCLFRVERKTGGRLSVVC